MILVFSEKSTSRLNYVLKFAFNDKGKEYKIINDPEDFENQDGIKLNYSNLQLTANYTIEPSSLLFEEDINPSYKLEKEADGLSLNKQSDELSIVFYILSRYEEYVNPKKDEIGRFCAKDSDLYQLDLIENPLCDQLIKELWYRLGVDYQEVLKRFECVPSFDIDVAWAYKGRPIWRTLGSMIVHGGEGRLKVLMNRQKDPYDTYSEIITYAAQLDRIICFALLSDYAPKDKNINWKNFEYQSLLRGLNSSGGMGIHPGFNSFLNVKKQREEIGRLEHIVGHEVVKSRFHYLRFQIPESYDILLQNGIKKDYSMGFDDHVGFRAGTSFPFNFFQLKENKETDLIIFPFTYMDSTLKDRMKVNPSGAIEKVDKLIEKVAAVGGLFMCIWHNHTINNRGEWEGWKKVLDHTVNQSIKRYR